MEKQLFFVSGLPRSGSTLLMNLLGQNPNHYVTPTSGLIEIFCKVKHNWKNILEFKTEGLDKVLPRLQGSMKGILHGYFEKEFEADTVVFDKSRGWLHYIEDLETVLDRPVKVICTVRDVRDIVASFEKIYRNRGLEYDYPLGEEFFKSITIEDRARSVLDVKGVAGSTIAELRDAIHRKVHDRLVIIPYTVLTEDPIGTMKKLHDSLGLGPFNYDPSNIEQVTSENDMFFGMDLHVIRPETSSQTETWTDVLPPRLAEEIHNTHKDIQVMAGVKI